MIKTLANNQKPQRDPCKKKCKLTGNGTHQQTPAHCNQQNGSDHPAVGTEFAYSSISATVPQEVKATADPNAVQAGHSRREQIS